MEKMTRVEALTLALESLTNEEAIDIIKKMISSIERKSASSSAVPTKTQLENVGVKTNIIEVLRKFNMPSSCSEIALAVGISPQKCSALLSQLVKENAVVRTTEKRKTYFSVAQEGKQVE